MRALAILAATLTISGADIGGGAVPTANYTYFTPQSYPDSLIDSAACAMPGLGLTCDPNGILTDGSGNLTANHIIIEGAVDRIRANTQCPCGAGDINLGQCKGEGGFTVSVALLNKMALNPDQESRMDRIEAAATFANTLRTRLDRGQCGDDALLLMSKYDNAIWTSVGEVTSRYLTGEIINTVTLNAEYYLRRGELTKGLNYTLSMYEQILRGEQPDLSPPSGWYWPIPLWAVIAIGVVLLLLLIAAIGGCVYCCVKSCCKKDTRGRYELGTRL